MEIKELTINGRTLKQLRNSLIVDYFCWIVLIGSLLVYQYNIAAAIALFVGGFYLHSATSLYYRWKAAIAELVECIKDIEEEDE